MSTIKVDTLTNTAGTKSVPIGTVVDGSAKAWVNFNGTGTPAVIAGFNVNNIVDNGVGAYTINFISAMPDVNYAVISTCRANNTTHVWSTSIPSGTAPTVSAVAISCSYTNDASTTAADPLVMNMAVFR